MTINIAPQQLGTTAGPAVEPTADNRTVTVVKWGQMGDFDDAPVAAFKKTTITAVNKLY